MPEKSGMLLCAALPDGAAVCPNAGVVATTNPTTNTPVHWPALMPTSLFAPSPTASRGALGWILSQRTKIKKQPEAQRPVAPEHEQE
jgi:hypothetical protein